MLELEGKLISDDVINEEFVCDLNKCKGACCVEGDLGAPLEEEELDIMDEMIPLVKPYLSKEAIEVLDGEGAYMIDEDGDYCTTTIDNKECTFAFYDEDNMLKCAIEQAHKDGKTDFKKPISCHLYPIRINKLPGFDALNYSRWHICSDACDLGAKLQVPVYQFLKEPLIRKYGNKWYKNLEKLVKDR